MNIKERLQKYIDNNLNSSFMSFRKARYDVEKACCLSSSPLEDMEECRSYGNNLDEFIQNEKNENKFQKLLFHYIDRNGLKDSDVYNKVHMDRRLFSKIRSDSEYHPSKETILLLGFALELNEKEIEELLESASYSLPRNNVYDLIIRFCFMEGIYELKDINELLDSYECKSFSY